MLFAPVISARSALMFRNTIGITCATVVSSIWKLRDWLVLWFTNMSRVLMYATAHGLGDVWQATDERLVNLHSLACVAHRPQAERPHRLADAV